MVLNEKKEEIRQNYVKSRSKYHQVGKYRSSVKLYPVKADSTPSYKYVDMEEIVEIALNLPDLKERINLLENNLTRIHTGSKPYFKYLINKFKSKLNGCWTSSYNENKCPINCNIDHSNKNEKR